MAGQTREITPLRDILRALLHPGGGESTKRRGSPARQVSKAGARGLLLGLNRARELRSTHKTHDADEDHRGLLFLPHPGSIWSARMPPLSRLVAAQPDSPPTIAPCLPAPSSKPRGYRRGARHPGPGVSARAQRHRVKTCRSRSEALMLCRESRGRSLHPCRIPCGEGRHSTCFR